MVGVIFFIASGLAFLSVSLVLPVVLSLIFPNDLPVGNLLVVTILGLFLSALILVSISGRKKGMNRVQSLLAVVLLWIVIPCAAAIPFAVTGTENPVNALFEAFSGITTTGASVHNSATELPLPMRLWRSQLEWIGGFMILVCVLHILAPAEIGGLPRAGGRFVRGERELTENLDIGRLGILLLQYGVITVVITLAFLMCGISGLDSLMLAMLAISTGGFVPVDQPLDLAIGQMGVFIMAVALSVGATSLFWQRYSARDLAGLWRRNHEATWIIRIIFAIALVYAFLLYRASGSSGIMASAMSINEGLFAAASLVSTSGIETRPGVIALFPTLLVVYIVLGGASMFSTSGGIKLYRTGGMLLQARRELNLLVYPSSVSSMRIGGTLIGERSAQMAWTVFILATVVLAGTSFIFAATGAGFEASFIAATALFANAGPIYFALKPLGADPAVWPTYADFPTLAKFAAIGAMVLGRLEVLVVLAAFNFNYWINR